MYNSASAPPACYLQVRRSLRGISHSVHLNGPFNHKMIFETSPVMRGHRSTVGLLFVYFLKLQSLQPGFFAGDRNTVHHTLENFVPLPSQLSCLHQNITIASLHSAPTLATGPFQASGARSQQWAICFRRNRTSCEQVERTNAPMNFELPSAPPPP